MANKNFMDESLKATQWVGVVEDNSDPLFEGRCKIRVFGKFDQRSGDDGLSGDFIIPTENLPWSRPYNSGTGGSDSGGGMHSVPKINSTVKVTFDNGNIYSPVYHHNNYISDELKEEIEGSYENSHSLVYDTEANPGPIKIFFTEDKGLMLDYNGSQVNIRPDNTIYIEHANGKIVHVQQDKISLGKEDESDEPAVLGEKNVDALNALADQINEVSKSIQKFALDQQLICSSIYLLAPLSKALGILSADQVPIQNDIAAPIKEITIPKTRSSTVSLDGPPKLG